MYKIFNLGITTKFTKLYRWWYMQMLRKWWRLFRMEHWSLESLRKGDF